MTKKISVALLSALTLLPPVAVGQPQVEFNIGDATLPDPWLIDDGEINAFSVDFDLQDYDPVFFSYTVDDSGCDDSASNAVAISNVDGSIDSGITVEFTNSGPVVNSYFCFTVKLFFAVSIVPVYTKTFIFDVTSSDDYGQLSFSDTILSDAFTVGTPVSEEVNQQIMQDRPDVVITTSSVSPNPIFLGDTITLEVGGEPSSYYLRIAACEVNLPLGGPGLSDIRMPMELTKGVSAVTFKIPIDYFAMASSDQPLRLALIVDWDVDGLRRLDETSSKQSWDDHIRASHGRTLQEEPIPGLGSETRLKLKSSWFR